MWFKKIKYYVSEFKSHYYCGALASHMTSPNSSPKIFGWNWVQPSQFGQLEHWLSTKKKVLKKLRREIKYHIFKSNTQILIIFPQFLMVLFLNMHKNVKRNGKNGLQYFLFFKKTKYKSSELDSLWILCLKNYKMVPTCKIYLNVPQQ